MNANLINGGGPLNCQAGCSGTVASGSYICTDFSLSENWSFGENRVAYDFSGSAGNTVTISFSGNAWISPFNSRWNVPTTFSLVRRNDTGQINSTPRAITSPVIRLQEGCNHTFPVAVSDPDGDIVRCRWAVGNECGGICNGFPGAELDSSSCTFTYEANRGAGFQAAAIVIEDFVPGSLEPLSTVALQFLVLVVSSADSCSQQPQFIPPTIQSGACVAIPTGTTFATQLIANSGGSSATIVEIQTISPLGTQRGELQRILNSDNYLVNITWTPQENQENQTHLFCFTALNSAGLASEQNCIQFLAGNIRPEPVPETIIPNRAMVHPFNTTWSITFSKDIERPSLAAYVEFHDFDTDELIYKIDASLSPEMIYRNNSQQLSILPNFRFPEKRKYYITLDGGVVIGLEGCGPGNEPITEDKNFWTFETIDITPPVIAFLENPMRSTANITLTWSADEEVVWDCELSFENEMMIVNCSGDFWRGYGLAEGRYELQVTATDLSSNIAMISHSFDVDLTPPAVSFGLVPAPVSNQLTPTFTFTCGEVCIFDCLLQERDGIRKDYFPCNQHFYTTPILEHNRTFTFSVVATDDVGNRGQEVTYTWETDFESPQISGVSNTSILCNDTTPDLTGRPIAVDNRPGDIRIMYRDNNLGCDIQRTWTATDIAGNTDSVTQNIRLEPSFSISLAPMIAFPCDSTISSFEVPSSTASAANPCQLPLELNFVDDVSTFTCPSVFTRNWTALVCDNSSTASQTIRLYDTCPPDACGRNETPPRGICSFGECRCSRPWFGSDCSVLIHKPLVGQINDTTLKEAEEYILTIPLRQGTPPLSWSLTSSPNQLRLDENLLQIRWLRAQGGTHIISLRVENEVGVAEVSWTLYVETGYQANLDLVSPNTFPRAEPISLTGRVEYSTDNLVRDFLAGIVPVSIDIFSRGSTRTITTFTARDDTFSVVYYPASTEYGTYRALARHPQSSPGDYQAEWHFLGMSVIPSRITLTGESISEFQETFSNATILCNDGPANLQGLRASTGFPNSEELTIDIKLQGSSTIELLKQGSCITVDISVTASRPLNHLFLVRFEADRGTSASVLVNLRIQQILPSFMINPPTVSTRIVRGRSRVFQFNITNTGRATAHGVQPVLPETDIFSFISLGSEQSSGGSGELNLQSGESATLSVLVRTDDSQQLGEITASFYLTSDEVSQRIPVSLIVSSNILMNLTVVVEDEYTYFASGEPLVKDAAVTLINYQRGLRIEQTTEERNGRALFTNINEDRYELFIEAPDHRSLRQVVVTSIENSILTVFLERQAVTISWSVTPVSFVDTYTLTIEADFETHVPIPVVTATPTEFDLEEIELGFIDSLQLNITNHGLIRANDVNIALPNNHPFLEFSISNDVLGNLEPLSSVTAVVHVSRKAKEKRALITTITWIVYAINIAYTYVCGELQYRSFPIVLRKPRIVTTEELPDIVQCIGCGGRIPGGGGGGGGFGGGGFGGGGGGVGGGSGGGSGRSTGPLFFFNGYSARTPAFCNKCLQSVLGCIPTPKFPLAGCIPLIVGGGGINGVVDVVKWINCVVPVPWVTAGLCIYDVYNNCFASGPGSSRRKKRSLLSTVKNHLEGKYPIDLSISVAVEVLGDSLWLSVGDPQWLSQVLEPALGDASEHGVLISATELSAILATPPPNGTTIGNVQQMVERLNNTLSGWNSGQLESVNGLNIASFSIVESLSNDIKTYNQIAVDKGFSSYLEAYTFTTSDINQLSAWEEEEGVCAVVRIRIEQELAVTREAFLARLEIENQEDSNLEQMDLEIIITDTNSGELSTHRFSIGNETLSGSLISVGNAWTLIGGESGAVEWLIVPLSEAAPQTDHVYSVGGTLRYTVDNENITIPLLPTLITVTPDPSLLVHYFWEKNVIADDPFTDEIEPSVPFTLGVVVKNAGYGTASSLTLASGQPEIIENEKGLLVDFMIIGANVGNGSISPSLSVTLGDLAPDTTVVVRWVMISSLQGEFKNYSATFENVNPLGDPRLSILDELEIHELIRNVRIHVDTDDSILDFLVNDRKDLESYPDALYDSETLTRYNVSRGDIASVRPVSDTLATLEVRVSSNHTGWVYFRYEDANGYLTQTALTLNSKKRSGNHMFSIPPENSWITQNSGKSELLVLHLVDFVNTTEEVTYLVTLCTANCVPITIPYLPPTATLPPTTTMMSFMNTTAEEEETEESGRITLALLARHFLQLIVQKVQLIFRNHYYTG